MTDMHVQTSGDFDKLDPVMRLEAREELNNFLDREKDRFKHLHLHAHLKRLHASLGNNPLLNCNVSLTTDKGRFNVSEEGFGVEAAVKSALLALQYRVQKHFDIRADNKEKVAGRKALAMES